MSSVTHVSLPKTFDSGKVSEWFQRFEICCRANGWDNDKMALKLPTLLEGEALAVWLELTAEEQKDYSATKQKIIDAIKLMSFVSLDDFHKRVLRPQEPLSLYVHELKQLLNQAMLEITAPTAEQLLLHQFLTGLPQEVSKQLRATGATDTLNTSTCLDQYQVLPPWLTTISQPQKTQYEYPHEEFPAITSKRLNNKSTICYNKAS